MVVVSLVIGVAGLEFLISSDSVKRNENSSKVNMESLIPFDK